jgi:hypothetical protein
MYKFSVCFFVCVFFFNTTSRQKETSYIAVVDAYGILLQEVQGKRQQGRQMET